ncbi:MAG: hypothetical protein ACKV2U_10980, partial [Bryobacteraceae bacterium]
LTLTYPAPGKNAKVDRILIGMHDAYSGLDMASFEVRADFLVAGVQAGQNLAEKFGVQTQGGVWALKLEQPLGKMERGRIVVSVRDRQGNLSRIDRVFSVGK